MGTSKFYAGGGGGNLGMDLQTPGTLRRSGRYFESLAKIHAAPYKVEVFTGW